MSISPVHFRNTTSLSCKAFTRKVTEPGKSILAGKAKMHCNFHPNSVKYGVKSQLFTRFYAQPNTALSLFPTLGKVHFPFCSYLPVLLSPHCSCGKIETNSIPNHVHMVPPSHLACPHAFRIESHTVTTTLTDICKT